MPLAGGDRCRGGLHANGDSFELRGGLHLPPVGTTHPTRLRGYWSLMGGGSSTAAGSSSGLARTKDRGCRNDLPDQATSAATSTTSGSIRVRCTGPLSLLNLFSEVSLISSGQGCPGCAGRSWRLSSRPARVERTVERPTIRSCPSMGKPAMIAWGCVKGPMTAAQTFCTHKAVVGGLRHARALRIFFWIRPIPRRPRCASPETNRRPCPAYLHLSQKQDNH